MTFDEYGMEAEKTLNDNADEVYLSGKLVSEAVEIFQPALKHQYHGKPPLTDDEFDEEIGDALWYLFVMARQRGRDMDNIARKNIEKLRQRHGERYNAAHYQKQDNLPVVRGYDFEPAGNLFRYPVMSAEEAAKQGEQAE